jgi:hypothetical protein
MLIVATTAEKPLLEATKLGMFPIPDAANPMDEVLLVQLKLAPAGELTKAFVVIVSPEQVAKLVGTLVIKGRGFTVTIAEPDCD